MTEKIVDESININTMIMEEKYDELYNYLNNTQRKNPIEKRILSVLDILYDVFDGVIFDSIDAPHNNFLGCINTHHFEEAKKYTDHQGIKLILDKIIKYNNLNVRDHYAGHLGNLFYDYARQIYESLQKNDFDYVRILIGRYLNIIEKDDYLYFFSKMVKVCQESSDSKEDIIPLLADVSTSGKVIDTKYLKIIFGKMINDGNFSGTRKLVELLGILKENDGIGIDVQFMEFVYDYEKYVQTGCTYSRLEDDENTIRYIEKLCNKVIENRNIESITIKDKRKASIVKSCLKENPDIGFTYISNDDKSITFYIRKIRSNHFRKEELIFKIKNKIEIQDFEYALKLLKEALSLTTDFDPYILSLMAYVYELTGDEDNLSYMKKVLIDICGVVDYHAYVESPEISLIDLDQNYMFGIPNVELIIDDLLNNDKTIEEVKNEYNIAEEDLPFVVILIAREAYKHSNYLLGNRFAYLAQCYYSSDKEYRRLKREINRTKCYYSNTNNNFVQYVRQLINKQ